jgi:hypothetical protein
MPRSLNIFFDRGSNIWVFSGEELIAALHDGHLHPDRVKEVGEFAAYITSTQNNDAIRQ